MEPFTFLPHTADIKIKLSGSTVNEIFENTVLAIASYVTEKTIAKRKGKTIQVQGRDTQSLLYNFIDEILYLIDADHFIPAKAEVMIRGNNLKAELYGDDSSKYHLQQIKAPTYAEMEIKKTDKNWEAIIVLDV